MNVDEPSRLHPFFTKPPATRYRIDCNRNPNLSSLAQPEGEHTDVERDTNLAKPRQKGLPQRIVESTSDSPHILDAFLKIESIPRNRGNALPRPYPSYEPARDLEDVRRKRRRISTSPERPLHVIQGGSLPTAEMTVLDSPAELVSDHHMRPSSGLKTEPEEQTNLQSRCAEESYQSDVALLSVGNAYASGDTGAPITDNGRVQYDRSTPLRAQRILQLNCYGTFGAPLAKNVKDKQPSKPRKRASGGNALLVIKYPRFFHGSNLGERIDRILKGTEKWVREVSEVPKATANKPSGPQKPTHPFFLDGGAKRSGDCSKPDTVSKLEEIRSPVPRRSSTVTPGKLRAEAHLHRSSMRQPDFGRVPAWRFVGPAKHSGQKDPPWPTAENSHIRAISDEELSHVSNAHDQLGFDCKERKGKQNVAPIPISENILEQLQHTLTADGRCKPEATPAGSSSVNQSPLRKPERLITTDTQIQQTAQDELQSNSCSSMEGLSSHPALVNLFADTEGYLAPFDLGQCETKAWPEKYAPKKAEHVLSIGQEAFLLREWLRKSVVTAIHVGSNTSSASGKQNTNKAPNKPEKKVKRRKADDLDDFIVTTDDETAELDDFTEVERPRSQDLKNKYGNTIVRGGLNALEHASGSHPMANTVLLSGPHGCGKTATVYAVAEELGFEVFEINSGTRRSGKDILDRIGDMAENHLVQRVAKTLLESQDEKGANFEGEKPSAETSNEKQKPLSTFFRTTKKAPIRNKPVPKDRLKDELMQHSRQREQQKQCVILLEEVDVLFEEDKSFWMTIIALARHSKRPIVLTCNDEDLVPLNALTLHAILRFVPPPTHLAIDYMLMIAAREGHLLTRDAVQTLYKSRNHELRSSLVQLNFWCQMGVGDEKGGLEWIYQRWPPGKDVDAAGRILRVASKRTYRAGMGWYNRDLALSSNASTLNSMTEMVSDARDEWMINDDDIRCSQTARIRERRYLEPHSQSISEVALVADSFSAADVYCHIDDNLALTQRLEASQPELTEKRRTDYTIGYPVLHDDTCPDYTKINRRLACSALTTLLYLGNSGLSNQNDYERPHDIISARDRWLIQVTLACKDRRQHGKHLNRKAFSNALDVLAETPGNESTSLTASSLDREFGVITRDIAPYVRTIAAYDIQLQLERLRLSNLLSAGGRPTKRIRTTRAARSALEGGQRNTTRRERWFSKDLNLDLVLATGGKEWAGLGATPPVRDDDNSSGGMTPRSSTEVDEDDDHEVRRWDR